MFEMGKDYTRDYIHTICGGNKQSFLPVHRGKVVAACLRPDLNPQAPEVIICNSGAAARAAGRTLAQQDGSIPVFIEQTTERLKYVGDFAVTESLTIPADCEPYAKNTGFTPQQISRVLKLKRSKSAV